MKQTNTEKHIFPEEFITFINSFNKNPGTFTDEELIQIGYRHKELDTKDKSWANLTDLLGVTKSPNAFRLWVNRNISEITLVSELVETVEEESTLSPYDTQMANLYKEKIKNRDILNAYRRLLREDSRIEVLRETVKDCVNSLNKLPKFDGLKFTTNHKNEAVLMLSDLHIGVSCNNFYNTYNTEVASKRLEKLVAEVIDNCRINNVKKLTILNLGDLIHGIIHTSARIEQEYDVINQIMTASELLSKTLNALQNAAPVVNYRSVTDNHSRANAHLSEHIEKENFNRLIDWYLEERLKDSKINFIHDNLDTSLGVFELDNGKKIAFAHGHLDDINSCFQHFVGATQSFIDYMLLGHYHCEKAKSFQGTKVFVNGSIVGTEQYALSKRLFSSPSQTLLIFKDKSLINVSIDLK